VTGALGHIGSALLGELTALRRPDLEIVAIDNLASQRFVTIGALPPHSFRLLPCDVRDALSQVGLRSADTVVHLAALAEPQRSAANPDEAFGHNVDCTKSVVNECARSGAHLIFPSSTSIYSGEGQMDERAAAIHMQPTNPYSRAKLIEESLIRNSPAGDRSTIFRLGTVFGVSPGIRFTTAVNKFCWQAAAGTRIDVYEQALNQVRPYLGVRDAAESLLSAVVDRELFAGQTINVASTHATVADVLNLIRAQGLPVATRTVPSPSAGQGSFSVSLDKASRVGLHPTDSLESGVAAVLNYLSSIYRVG
jgi:UDP-glucose 4-epimerase